MLNPIDLKGILLFRNIPVGDNSALLELARKFGRPMLLQGPFEPTAIEDEVVYRVEPSRVGRKSVISETDGPFDFHTDGFRSHVRPETLALLSVVEADEGGESMLVRIGDVLPMIPRDDLMHLLTHQYPLKSGISRTILEYKDDGRVEVCYNPYDIIGLAVCDRHLLCPAELLSALSVFPVVERFHRTISTCPLGIMLRLKRGECAVIDNTSILHARRAFSGHRLLKRVWIEAGVEGCGIRRYLDRS